MNGAFAEFFADIDSFFQFLISPQLQGYLLVIKVLFIIVSLVFLFLIIYFARRSSYLKYLIFEDRKNWKDWKDYGKSSYVKKWQAIKKRLDKESPAENKLALVESAKMLNEVLEKLGYLEENLTDKLSHFDETKLSNIAELQKILEVYQTIAQDPDYKLEKEKALAYLKVFENSFKELEVL